MTQTRLAMIRNLSLLLILPLFAAVGAEFDAAVVGKSKPAWRDLPSADGTQHSLADLNDKEVVVIAVTCNHCPLALEYFDRLKQFAQKHAASNGKAALVAISLSNQETDKLPRMKELAQRNAFNFPYIHDASQQIGRQLGATKTPQFFVLDRNRTLVYRGAWDDNVNPVKVKQHYVESVVDALIAGKSPPISETKAFGCIIGYDK
jgi:peroxiredoxin